MLIVGLGNPGKEYEDTRHNVGWIMVDAIASQYGFPSPTKKFKGEYSQGKIDGNKVYLIKPTTYMNLSGECVGEIARFYKIDPEDVLVIYDELDLEVGKLRIKLGGGHNGHNGIKSIDSHLGKNYQM